MKLSFDPTQLRERAANLKSGSLFTPLPLHIAGVVVLAALNIYLAAHLAFAYGSIHGNNDDALALQASQMKAAEIAARPLRGLDEKLALAENDQASFYQDRLPTAYSTVAGQLGDLAKKNNVRLTRVQYTQSPGLDGAPEYALTQVTMDATLSGDYRPLVTFLNDLERNKSFFLVSGITLSGQQSGTVNLRMRIVTYLRAPGAGEALNSSPASGDTDAGKGGTQ
ncbi:MAG TPA: GspMb/PilO family protein [Acidobacteriaceae bacterium]|nr:GspMb/PilO family protein [Acidobacteriaceae bacterium]